MKKRILSLLTAFLCTVGATACTGSVGSGDGGSSEDSAIESVYERYAEVPVEYQRQTAECEDESLSLWFDHSFAKTVSDDTESTGRDTYKIYMGKNEKEDCQFFLSSDSEKTFSVFVSDFTSQSGASVPVTLFYQYYFAMPYRGADEKEVPDAIPSVAEGAEFTLEAGTSAGFVLQARTTAETPAGEYTADLNIYDEQNRQIKTATVFLRVWDFVLSENSACRTAVWIDKNRLGGHDYKTLYDYLLDNRVNAYDLPYSLDDGRVDEYLDDPRVNSFNILGFKFNKESGKSEAQIKNAIGSAYEKLSQKQSWKEKGYFYLVDEPTDISALGQIKEYGEWLEELYPGYRQLSPFFVDKWYDGAKTQDWIEFMRPYINIWVPKTYAYTTLRQYANITDGKCLYQEGQEGALDAKFGSYPKRIKNMVEEDGAEAWWYVTSQPGNPYITFNTTEPGVAYRILFWQQKMNDVTGLLYWSANYWEGDGWNNRPGEWTAGSITYGNGQLMYPGGKVGADLPVGSLRLEAIRDGIEDYQMLASLEKYIGKEKTDELINRTTTHVAMWNSDEDAFAGERIISGNYLEAVAKD